jgi:uncharacterized protein involved in exopolysaccharide biosynthesis
MDNAPAFHALDYVSVLRRRMWWFLVPVALALVIGAALIMWLPRQYQGKATLSVSLPMVSQELVGEAQRSDPEERRRAITQVLLSPVLLERVVREEGLDKGRTAASAAEAIKSRVDVQMPPPDPSLPPGTLERFFILYRDSTPEQTQRLTNRFADVFVDESSK